MRVHIAWYHPVRGAVSAYIYACGRQHTFTCLLIHAEGLHFSASSLSRLLYVYVTYCDEHSVSFMNSVEVSSGVLEGNIVKEPYRGNHMNDHTNCGIDPHKNVHERVEHSVEFLEREME